MLAWMVKACTFIFFILFLTVDGFYISLVRLLLKILRNFSLILDYAQSLILNYVISLRFYILFRDVLEYFIGVIV